MPVNTFKFYAGVIDINSIVFSYIYCSETKLLNMLDEHAV